MSARAAAALAAGMGLGRFAYTPILPLMTAQAGLTTSAGASLATANYLGYLAGALVTVVRPVSRSMNRFALLLLVVSLAAMPLTHGVAAWFVLRFAAGVASALVFVAAVSAGPGWGIAGVGAGIAASGVIVLVSSRWQTAWWITAVLSALLAALAWSLRPRPRASAKATCQGPFKALFTAYTLEGVGYIIAGTFLVAAAGPLGSGAWVLTGLAAAASPFLLARFDRRHALTGALVVQAIGIALAALDHPIATIAAFVLFGATFLGIAITALKFGATLDPNAAALLTAGYSAGQVVGPLLAAPLIKHGYDAALLLAGAVVLTAAVVIALSRRVRLYPPCIGRG